MIINISGRTDIVNHYSNWFFKRLESGYVYSRNSLFPNSVRKYELIPEKVDCLIFGSKNYAPVLDRIEEITNKFTTYFYYTITAYGKDVEPGVPSIDENIDTLIKLSNVVGKQKVAWRFDPILLTEKYTVEKNIETFEYIISKIYKYIDRCIFSFVEMYKKHEINFPELIPLNEKEKDYIAKNIGRIAKKYNIVLQTCGPEENYKKYGIQTSACVTLDILGKANNVVFRKLKHKGFRKGCHCIESRDIGAINSCPNGCKYCYANKNNKLALENYKLHNEDSPLLIGHLKDTDRLEDGSQKTFLVKK